MAALSAAQKVVLATNVAETSLTVPDVAHVVDCGLVKEMRFRPESGLSTLETVWARAERFDRRPIEPFELFTSEFGQNSVRIQENSSKIFRKFLKFEKFSTFSKVFSEIPRNFRQNRCKIR